MKLTIERSTLLKALAHVQSVVERRNTIPILSNVLLDAQKSRLLLTATDMDIAIVESVDADVARSGAVTIPAHTLYDIVRKLAEGMNDAARVERAQRNIDALRQQIASGAAPAPAPVPANEAESDEPAQAPPVIGPRAQPSAPAVPPPGAAAPAAGPSNAAPQGSPRPAAAPGT